jgi:hypothetical protein
MTPDQRRVEGFRAFEDELDVKDNPYAEGTDEYEFWEQGWYDAWGEWFYKDWEPDWFKNR